MLNCFNIATFYESKGKKDRKKWNPSWVVFVNNISNSIIPFFMPRLASYDTKPR